MTKKGKIIGLYKIGNTSLGDNILIFNMGTATDCPAKKLGLCKTSDICYAYKSERLWKEVSAYRKRQSDYWLLSNVETIKSDIKDILDKAPNIEYFRYNESGDFYDFSDIVKLDIIAKWLKSEYNIITFGYTARSDLFSVNDNYSFIVRGSGFSLFNGSTVVLGKDFTPEFFRYDYNFINNRTFKVCPKTQQNRKEKSIHKIKCGTDCKMCMSEDNIDIGFKRH